MTTQDMLGKVRALIDTAESYEAQGNAEAAATYRTKAEQLMVKYRIAEEEAIAQDPTSVDPIYRAVTLVTGTSAMGEFQQQYINLFWVVARHAGIRTHFRLDRVAEGGYGLVAHSVGYEGDLGYAEMLFTAARLVFSERLEPKYDPTQTAAENVYRLRGAGMERVRVADLVFNSRDKASLSKVGRMYKAECARRGEKPALDGRGITGKAYREQYATEFVWSFDERLRRAQDSAGQMGGGVTLFGRKERVDAAFYDRYPEYRPQPALPAGECEDCKRTKHESGKCKVHRPRPITKAEMARYARHNSPAAVRGREAGAAAARQVDLTRGHTAAVKEGAQAPEWMLGR